MGWGRPGRRAWLAGGAAGVLVVVLAGTVLAVRATRPSQGSHGAALTVAAATPTPDAATPTPTETPAPSPTTAATPRPAAPDPGAAPARFGTLPPGAALPSDAQCAAWVRSRPIPENKGANRATNQTTGHHVGAGFFPAADDARANQVLGPRIDGQFTGTTHEILRWVACKWGIDEDVVAAQAAVESWWQQSNRGDWGTDAAACAPGHGLGVDGRPGQCPQSYGILQDRYPFEQTAWPGIATSTAMNADTSIGILRACFEGYERWLNDVDRVGTYGPGDLWGCLGRQFSGRWHTQPSNDYAAKVRGYLDQRIWETPSFQQP
jgi:hypothetical protein